MKTGKLVSGCNTEKDIFTVLKMKWKEPHERLGPEAIEDD
jgi:DNA polymerase/3'-5' exonuclease PolX